MGVNAIVGTSVGAAVAARVGILVGAEVAELITGLVVTRAGLQPLSMIRKIVIPQPNRFVKCFFISFASRHGRRAYERMTYEIPPVLRLEFWLGINRAVPKGLTTETPRH